MTALDLRAPDVLANLRAGRPLHVDPSEVVRLALVAGHFMGAPESLELVRNVVCALQDGIEDPESTIRTMIEMRRAMFGLDVHRSRVDELVAALTDSWNTRDQ